jgi:hypothetical protein
MYFTLVKRMADPIIDHLPNPSSDEDIMQLTRRTSAVCLIESDLTDALLYLINQYMQLREGKSFKEQLMLY